MLAKLRLAGAGKLSAEAGELFVEFNVAPLSVDLKPGRSNNAQFYYWPTMTLCQDRFGTVP
jgi:hypothetical protein